jgi:hypothetical protein
MKQILRVALVEDSAWYKVDVTSEGVDPSLYFTLSERQEDYLFNSFSLQKSGIHSVKRVPDNSLEVPVYAYKNGFKYGFDWSAGSNKVRVCVVTGELKHTAYLIKTSDSSGNGRSKTYYQTGDLDWGRACIFRNQLEAAKVMVEYREKHKIDSLEIVPFMLNDYEFKYQKSATHCMLKSQNLI